MPTKPDKDIEFAEWVDGQQKFFPFSGQWPTTVRDDRIGIGSFDDTGKFDDFRLYGTAVKAE